MIFPCISIDDSADKGKGLFTTQFIQANVIIEISPVIVMTDEERKLLDQTLLHDYIFEWNPDGKEMCCMALGYVPLYNHSYQSNCEYFMDYQQKLIIIKTVRDIQPDEELTINYNGDWDNKDKVWFEAK